MKKSIVNLLIIIIIVGSMMVTGCSTTVDSVSKNKDNHSLVVGILEEPVSLDPHYDTDSESELVNSNIYESLLIYDYEVNDFVPCIAKSWEVSSDGLEYIFYLKKGIRFHNGKELKASDVKFSYNRIRTCPTAELIECVKEITVIDDYTIRIDMDYPYSAFLYLVATPQFSIVNEESLKEAGDNINRKAVGTGPYKLVKWISGDELIFTAFEDYHGGKAPIKNIILKKMGNSNAALYALQEGKIDFLTNVSCKDKQSVIDNEKLTYLECEALGFDYLALNCQKEPFNNVLVRQALAHCLDLDAILHVALNDGGAVAENIITSKAFGYTDKVVRHPMDIEKAKDLLEKAGYPNGFDTTIMTTSGVREKEAKVIQALLSEIGINAEIVIYEWGLFLDLAKSGEYDLHLNNWGYLTPDADEGVYSLLHSNSIGDGNRARYSNNRADELLEIGHTSSSSDERLDAYEEFTKIIYDEVPLVPLVSRYMSIGFNKNLKGVIPRPQSFHYFNNYSWDK